jgi:hypothetical protein
MRGEVRMERQAEEPAIPVRLHAIADVHEGGGCRVCERIVDEHHAGLFGDEHAPVGMEPHDRRVAQPRECSLLDEARRQVLRKGGRSFAEPHGNRKNRRNTNRAQTKHAETTACFPLAPLAPTREIGSARARSVLQQRRMRLRHTSPRSGADRSSFSD